jgi:hypothetical protein
MGVINIELMYFYAGIMGIELYLTKILKAFLGNVNIKPNITTSRD